MDALTQILITAGVLGAMGLLFGLLLMLAAKLFDVPQDPKVSRVRQCLPGANCGGCGYPGCDSCAEAIAQGKAPVNACPVGGQKVADAVADVLGVEKKEAGPRMVSTVICQGASDLCAVKFDYTGIQDCVAASLVNDGYKVCKFACLGLGTCVRACPFDAIRIDPDKHIAVVNADKCTACGRCVEACPKGVLSLRPVTEAVGVRCRNTAPAKQVLASCKVGCIHCGKCARACPYDAIRMVNGLPVIDREKCRNCMRCADVCPTKAMWADFSCRNEELNQTPKPEIAAPIQTGDVRKDSSNPMVSNESTVNVERKE